LLFGHLDAPLLQPEDAYYAEIPREMYVAGSWIVPRYHGQPYYEKPPLFYWLILASYTGLGVHDWAARLVPCTAALGCIVVVFWWGKRTLGLRAGVAAALILCLSPRFLHQARMITMDGLLCLCVTTALALGQQALEPARLRWRWWLLSAAAGGLGLLTKGPVALTLVAVPLFGYRLLDRRRAGPSVWSGLAYLGTAVGLALPWYATMAWREPGFLREFFWIHHVVLRFLAPLHEEPVWFYLPVLLLGMLPWTLLVPALIRLVARRREAATGPAALRFALLCCLWCLVLYSVAGCKRMGYILPAMPLLALALGYTLDQLLGCAGREEGVSPRRQGTRLPYWATHGVLAVGIGSALAAAFADLVTPAACVMMVALALGGIGWAVVRCRRLTPAGCWVGCALATFGVLLLAVHVVLPGYYRKFSLRAQVCSIGERAYQAEVPVVCYPHAWDSIRFYLGRDDIRSYGTDERDRLLGDLERCPETVLFVKSGPALDDLVRHFPDSLEFVPRDQSGWVAAALVQRRHTAGVKPAAR
jgi:4-amino-4-deoxy-L-arabinose transferase-like glycosyltransferase